MAKPASVYLEEFFSDVVTLAYSYALGLLLLSIHPLRGSIRLHARRHLSQKRQLSPHATLFLTVGLLFMLLTMYTRQMGAELGHYAASGHTPHSTQQVLVAALITVIVIDIGLSGAARLLFKRDRRRRRRFVDLGIYCSCSSIVYFGICAVPAYQWLREFVDTLTMAN